LPEFGRNEEKPSEGASGANPENAIKKESAASIGKVGHR
jgi:hypothetical protein